MADKATLKPFVVTSIKHSKPELSPVLITSAVHSEPEIKPMVVASIVLKTKVKYKIDTKRKVTRTVKSTYDTTRDVVRSLGKKFLTFSTLREVTGVSNNNAGILSFDDDFYNAEALDRLSKFQEIIDRLNLHHKVFWQYCNSLKTLTRENQRTLYSGISDKGHAINKVCIKVPTSGIYQVAGRGDGAVRVQMYHLGSTRLEPDFKEYLTGTAVSSQFVCSEGDTVILDATHSNRCTYFADLNLVQNMFGVILQYQDQLYAKIEAECTEEEEYGDMVEPTDTTSVEQIKESLNQVIDMLILSTGGVNGMTTDDVNEIFGIEEGDNNGNEGSNV